MHNSISDMILDCLQNSIEASASLVVLDFEEDDKNLFVKITDNGKGMDKVTLEKAKDPFWTDGIKHKHRKVGLGIPFLIQTVDSTGGSYSITSEVNVGTVLSFRLDLSNIDLPPIGDIVQTFFSAMIFDGDYQLIVNRNYLKCKYILSRKDLLDALGDFSDIESLHLLKMFLKDQETDIEEIKNGKNDIGRA